MFDLKTFSKPFPNWFKHAIKYKRLPPKFKFNNYLQPSFLEADFNGDGIKDIVVPIIGQDSKQKGLLIFHQHGNFYVIGAGTKFGNGGEDFKWAGGYSIFKNKIAYKPIFNKAGDIVGSKPVRLMRNAIFIYSLESGLPDSGGLIYWCGDKYIWIQQGE